VTADEQRLRFESVSLCAGVSARLDILPTGLDGDIHQHGTTNIDIGPQLQPVLAAVRRRDPVRLGVGTQGLRVTTTGGSVTERKVPLPDRWLRALTETQVITASFDLRIELAPRDAMAFLYSLPTGRSSARHWAVPSGRTLRLRDHPVPGAVCLTGAHRLAVLTDFWRFGAALQAYGPSVTANSSALSSVWVVSTPTARLSLTLSPDVWQGLSGEGAALERLASGRSQEDADLVSVVLAADPAPDVDRLTSATGLTPARIHAAFSVLATSGQIGYDVTESAYFHRSLPFDLTRIERANPRLAAARRLVAAGAVTPDRDGARVVSGDTVYELHPDGIRLRCTCRWWTDHDGRRGPCKHELAARIVQDTRPEPSAPDHGP
jgi:hypothetical protein